MHGVSSITNAKSTFLLAVLSPYDSEMWTKLILVNTGLF